MCASKDISRTRLGLELRASLYACKIFCVQDQESLQSDTLPLTKRTHDNSCHDYKKTLPLPKNKIIFPHLTKRQVENLALSSDSDFD